MSYRKKDIVLVPFPFNDRETFKKRPVVILNKDEHYIQYKKYVCVAITSKEKDEDQERYEHKLNKARTIEVGLVYDDQWVLPDKVFSIEDRLIIRKLGKMDEEDFSITEAMFHGIFK